MDAPKKRLKPRNAYSLSSAMLWMFHRQFHRGSCGAAHEAVVSSHEFMLQNHSPSLAKCRFLFNRRRREADSMPLETARHLPQEGLLHWIHSESNLRFRPRVTALEERQFSALSAFFSFFVHTFKNDLSWTCSSSTGSL